MAASPGVSPPLASALLANNPNAAVPAPATSPVRKKERRLIESSDALTFLFMFLLALLSVVIFAIPERWRNERRPTVL